MRLSLLLTVAALGVLSSRGATAAVVAATEAPSAPTSPPKTHVSAINAEGTGSPSPSSAPVVPATVPDGPAAPIVISKTTTSISLSWVAPPDGGRPITDYRIEYSTDGTIWTVFSDGVSNATTATVTGLTRGTGYLFRISAVNAKGSSFSSSGVVRGASTGLGHSCGLFADTTIKCWGENYFGELGNGTTTDSTTPVAVIGVTGATAISAGGHHSCVLLSDTTIKCWGRNQSGQLGNGTTTDSTTPVAVSGISGATAISTGLDNSCALLSDATIKCWGDNGAQQHGDTMPYSALPVAVSGISGATAISTGRDGSCALLSDTTIKCWGRNQFGELGNGTTADSTTPVAVTGVTGATAISSGPFHSCALLSDTRMKCWGRNQFGELGNGTKADSTTPVAVTGVTGATAISTGDGLSCALLSDATIKCWGNNGNGQLGNGTTTGSTTPVAVIGITGATAISTGDYHSCALLGDTTLKCWGYNYYGQFGNGTITNSATPVTAIIGRVLEVVPAAVPAAPSNVAATWGLATSASVSWSVPDSGGRPITDYKVEFSVFGVQWTTVSHAASDTTTVNVPGLVSSRGYKFRVSALNSEGFGPTSMITLGAAVVTSPPTTVLGVVGDGKVTVSWSAPLNNAGGAITGYTVTSSPDGKTCAWSGGPLTCVVAGLTNATGYTFSVTATNFTGTSLPSAPSATVTPRTVPQVPLGASSVLASNVGAVSSVAINGGGSTFFTAAGKATAFRISPTGVVSAVGSGFLNAAGIAVDSIGRVYVADTGDNRVVRIALNGTVSTIGTGLKAPKGLFITSAGDLYVADSGNNRIVKITSAGVQSVLGSGFSAPSGVALDATGFVYVADTGNNRVVKIGAFGVQTTIGTGYSSPTAISLDGTGMVYFADRSNNRIVKVTTAGVLSEIKAGFMNPTGVVVNAAGDLTIADTGNTKVTRLRALPTVTAGSGQATISWTAPSFNGGAAITGYKVTAVGNPNKTCTTTGATTCAVTGLAKGVSYTFTVVAINEAGSSAPSATTKAVISA